MVGKTTLGTWALGFGLRGGSSREKSRLLFLWGISATLAPQAGLLAVPYPERHE